MEDYGSNSKKSREAKPKPKTEKVVEQVISTTVVVKKKSLGRKFRDVIMEADFKGTIHFVAANVLLPAARNMIVDSATKGIERMMYGESTSRHRGYNNGPRFTYNNPINRDPRQQSSRYAPSVPSGPRSRQQEEFILSSREEAELVLERLNDIIETYEVASVADLNELVGFPTSHLDNKFGWVFLGDVRVRQVREGYLIELPPAEPINQ